MDTPPCTCRSARRPYPNGSGHALDCPGYEQWAREQRALREAEDAARAPRMLGWVIGLAVLAVVGVAVTVALRILVFRG